MSGRFFFFFWWLFVIESEFRLCIQMQRCMSSSSLLTFLEAVDSS